MNGGLIRESNHELPKPLFDSQPLRPPRISIATTVTIAIFHQLLRAASAILDCSKQEFDIAFRPGDRAFALFRKRPSPDILPSQGRTDAGVNRRIADDTALPHFLPPCLELRLDQGDQLRAGPGQLRGVRGPWRGRMKLASQTTMSIGSGMMLAVEASRVGLLVDDHARVLAKLPGELVGADIDRINLRRAAARAARR